MPTRIRSDREPSEYVAAKRAARLRAEDMFRAAYFPRSEIPEELAFVLSVMDREPHDRPVRGAYSGGPVFMRARVVFLERRPGCFWEKVEWELMARGLRESDCGPTGYPARELSIEMAWRLVEGAEILLPGERGFGKAMREALDDRSDG